MRGLVNALCIFICISYKNKEYLLGLIPFFPLPLNVGYEKKH